MMEQKKLQVLGPRIITPEIQITIDDTDKVKKGGKKKQTKEGLSTSTQTPKKRKGEGEENAPAPFAPKK